MSIFILDGRLKRVHFYFMSQMQKKDTYLISPKFFTKIVYFLPTDDNLVLMCQVLQVKLCCFYLEFTT